MIRVWPAGVIGAACAVSIALTGCGHSDQVQPLSSALYYDSPQPIVENSSSEIDRPTVVDVARAANEAAHEPQAPLPNPEIVRPGQTTTAPASTQSSANPAVDPLPATASSADPPATPGPVAPGVTSGTYLMLGCVVAEVNGKPIYANKILALNDVVLAVNARQMSQEQFRLFAQEQITNTITEQIRNELEFAAAQRLLGEQDQKLANALTQDWRRQRITEAGGSIEKARKIALDEDGADFDELVKDHFRSEMAQIYYERKINPRIEISAELMRRYYDRHVSQFCTSDKVLFRLIKIDSEKQGGESEARDKAAEIYKRAMAGEDFDQLCQKENDEDRFRTFGTDRNSDWIGKGTFRYPEVEDAIWHLEPGKISEPVEAGSGFYIAKLIDRTIGQTHSFSEEAVQDRIRGILRTQQFRELQESVQNTLRQGAIVQVYDPSVTATIEMAMQKYVVWSAKPLAKLN